MSRLSLLRRSDGARRRLWAAAMIMTAGTLAAMVPGAAAASGHATAYQQVNLVSDQPGVAPLTDPDLVNAWGLAASPGTDTAPGSPMWVADNGSDKATLYAGATSTSVSKASLVVNVTGTAPTGEVFNTSGSGFTVSDNQGHSGSSLFLFDTENGTIDGWNPAIGAATEVARDNGANAVYKGLALAQASDGKTYLYATNFRSGRVEAYDSSFTPVELPGGLFVDPRLPAGYGPFGIAEINGLLYVTFAKQDATLHDDVAGQGNGFVDVFTNDGAFVRRLVTRGALDSPWGLALAPAGFGQFGGDLLVGNFGNGHINVYSPVTGAHLGQLRQGDGHPIVIDGLWGLRFGNGNAAKTSELVFSAGPDEESHGLLGKIVVAP
ncbi:MAG: TIGR03118 family protein [Actinobacteria bacterium]|nr:TIGR03118 family protein [Actinomycetota bacterium]